MNIKIDSCATRTKVFVDGQELSHLTGVRFNFGLEKFPEVEIDMSLISGDVDITDGVLKIGSIEMPESVEQALFDYLCEKYPRSESSVAGGGSMVGMGEWPTTTQTDG